MTKDDLGFRLDGDVLRWADGGCRPAERAEMQMWEWIMWARGELAVLRNTNEQLVAECDHLRSQIPNTPPDEPACEHGKSLTESCIECGRLEFAKSEPTARLSAEKLWGHDPKLLDMDMPHPLPVNGQAELTSPPELGRWGVSMADWKRFSAAFGQIATRNMDHAFAQLPDKDETDVDVCVRIINQLCTALNRQAEPALAQTSADPSDEELRHVMETVYGRIQTNSIELSADEKNILYSNLHRLYVR